MWVTCFISIYVWYGMVGVYTTVLCLVGAQIFVKVNPESDCDDHVSGEQSHSDQPVRGSVFEGEGDEHHRQEEGLRLEGTHVHSEVLVNHPTNQNKKWVHHQSYLSTRAHGNA